MLQTIINDILTRTIQYIQESSKNVKVEEG
jgi:hypothetical protein